MIITLTLLLISLALVWACRQLPALDPKEFDMYHTMSPERAADLLADQLSDDDEDDAHHNAEIDAALDDFYHGTQTAPLDYEFVQDHLIDEGAVFTLIEAAWRSDDFTTLGKEIKNELNRSAEACAEVHRR